MFLPRWPSSAGRRCGSTPSTASAAPSPSPPTSPSPWPPGPSPRARPGAGISARCAPSAAGRAIQPDVLRAFLDRFARQGLRPESILPSYGMAEATLAITFADVTAKLTPIASTSRPCRRQGLPAGLGQAMELVSCAAPSRPRGRHRVPRWPLLGEREVGEIRLRGPSVTAGYYGDPEAPRGLRRRLAAHRRPRLPGQGELYICGRAKDSHPHGKNYYPQDIERIVSRIDGGATVSASPSPARRRRRRDRRGGRRVAQEHRRQRRGHRLRGPRRARPDRLRGLLHQARHLPKTSSGKVRRRECRRRLEVDELELVSENDADSVDTALPASVAPPPPSPLPPEPMPPLPGPTAPPPCKEPRMDPVRPKSKSATTSPTSSSASGSTSG